MTKKEPLTEEIYRDAVQEIANFFFADKKDFSTLYLIRHGKDELPTQANNYDPPLTSQGVSNAHLVGKRLASYGVTQLISSSLLRAKQTGDIIASYIGLPNQIVADLQEIKPTGDFATYARSLLETTRLWNKGMQNSRGSFNQEFYPVMPGLESGKALRARAVNTINSILNKYAGQKIAVVTHYSFINAYVSEMLGLEGDGFLLLADTGISVVRAYQEYRALISLNDTGHA